MRQLGWLPWVGLAASCWTSSEPIDGAFTQAQFEAIKQQLTRPLPGDSCAFAQLAAGAPCSAAIDLARDLFFDKALSAGSTYGMCTDPNQAATPVACATCHDPRRGLIDTRSPDNVSAGALGPTGRNAPTLFDLAFKVELAPADNADTFTWSGGSSPSTTYTRPGQVFELALTRPMASNDARVACVVRNTPSYLASYETAFGTGPGTDPDSMVVARVEQAFDTYFATLNSVPSAFDRYLAGDDGAISTAAQLGFGVFAGRGQCIECHGGPLLSDLAFHDTGVPQTGAPDIGHEAVEPDGYAASFLTPPLRGVAATGPYMHDGSLATLDDVVAFYNAGGAAGAGGPHDPRVVPLGLEDDDAANLVAFLRSLGASCIGSDGLPADATLVPSPCDPCEGRCTATQMCNKETGTCE
ncbi:MAG TPA: cytochrome c peroxidase [Kofleriaceae bacterium]|nr:cytochrome c peroxidase [Kofleriaceae bacterium]